MTKKCKLYGGSKNCFFCVVFQSQNAHLQPVTCAFPISYALKNLIFRSPLYYKTKFANQKIYFWWDKILSSNINFTHLQKMNIKKYFFCNVLYNLISGIL